MTESSTTAKPLTTQIYENIPSIGAILLIIICMISYFVQGGWWPSGRASLWLSLTLPFVTVIASVFLILVHVRHIMNRDSRWYNSIILLGTFAVVLVSGLTFGLDYSWFMLWFSLFGQGATAGVFGMASIGLIMGYFRIYIARSSLRILMIVVGLLGVAYGTGIIQTLVPWLSGFYLWEQAYVIGQTEFGVWMAYHIGEIALITRVIMLQEKLRPR
jgi:hypothetical protein